MNTLSRSKLPSCRKCPFYTHSFIPSEGPENAELVIVGDSGWKTEEREQRPFCGPSGEVLDFVLEESGIDRGKVYLTNAVMCKPEALGVPYPDGVQEQCVETFLKPALERINPRLVVPMGALALKAFTTDRGGITKVRGFKQTVNFFGHDLTILPTFHPAFILRKPAMADIVVADLKQAKENGVVKPTREVKYRAADTEARLVRFFELADEAEVMAWDLETTGLDYRTDDVISMNFSFHPYEGYAILFYVKYPDKNPFTFTVPVLRRLWKLLHSGKVIFGHNFKFDLRMMHEFFTRYLGYGVEIDKVRWYDTQGMYALLDENGFQTLKVVAPLHTDIHYTREELENVTKRLLAKIPKQKLVDYGVKDADGTRRIGLQFLKRLREQRLWNGPFVGKDYSDMSVANVLFKMELFGAPVDRQEMHRLKHLIQKKLDMFTQNMIMESEEFNPRSPDQLAHVLYDVLRLPDLGARTAGGKRSTDKNVIDALMQDYGHDPFLQALKLYRQYDSIQKTFVNGFEKLLGDDGRLHPDFGFTRTVSGRIVCYKPNLANIPRDKEFESGVFLSIRKMFTARPGWCIGYADASQIEFKVAALASGDKALIHAVFVEGEDFHTLIARAAYADYAKSESYVREFEAMSPGDQARSWKFEAQYKSALVKIKEWRTHAKQRNFGRQYGGQSETLAATMGVSVEEVEALDQRIAKKYPRYIQWIEKTPERLLELGEVRIAHGRIRRFPPTPDERTRAEQGRQGLNVLGQGPAAYVERGALVRIARAFEHAGMQAYPFNIVYDAILFESPLDEWQKACYIVAKQMLRPVEELENRIFTVEMGVAGNWADAEKAAIKIKELRDIKQINYG